MPDPSKVSHDDFEEAVAYLRAAASVINHDLRDFDTGGLLTAATLATTGRVMRSLSEEILKLLKEEY